MQEMPRRSPGGDWGVPASSIAKSTNARNALPREPSKFILTAPPRLFAVAVGPWFALERLERQSGYIAAGAKSRQPPIDCQSSYAIPGASGNLQRRRLNRRSRQVDSPGRQLADQGVRA